MDKKLLKEILSIPSHSKKERLIRNFLMNWGYQNELDVKTDPHGNVFIRKGVLAEGESYPCVVAHMDTVHKDQYGLIDRDGSLIIKEGYGQYGDILYAHMETYNGLEISTGCGGDDKAGIFIALEIIKNTDKIMGAFFVEEEIGCNGSAQAQDDDWLNEAGYFIQFDAPTDNWISEVSHGIQLFNDGFREVLQPTWDRFEMSKPSKNDPFTDIKELKKNYPVCCINYFAGYMDMHTKYEFVVLDYVEKAVNLGMSSIVQLGNKRYEFEYIK